MVGLLFPPTLDAKFRFKRYFKKFKKSVFGIEFNTGFRYLSGDLVNKSTDGSFTLWKPHTTFSLYFVKKFPLKIGVTQSLWQLADFKGTVNSGESPFYTFKITPNMSGLGAWVYSTGVSTLWVYTPRRYFRFLKKRKLELSAGAETGLIYGNTNADVTFASNSVTNAAKLKGATLSAKIQAGGWYWSAGMGMNWVRKKRLRLGMRFDFKRTSTLTFGTAPPHLYDFPKEVDVSKIEYESDIPSLAVYKDVDSYILKIIIMYAFR